MIVRNSIQCLGKKLFKRCNTNYDIQSHLTRKLSAEARYKRNQLFNLEKSRQKEAVGRIEKIEVRYLGTPEDVTLIMNKNISTPFNCAQHLSEVHMNRALAFINGHTPWDMHRPLEETCTLQLLNFTVAEPQIVNRAFWRTCSFLLGALIQNVFKENIPVSLHSFPGPNIRSGSFVHDFELGVPDWKPTTQEMVSLSAEMVKLCAKNLPIERLDVSSDLALEMFKENAHKSKQIPSIAIQTGGIITLYRVNDHIDISRGPMVGNTSQIGRSTIASLHKIPNTDTVSDGGQLYRLQGVALPKELIMNHVAYGIIEDRARQLNPSRLPHEPYVTDEPRSAPVAAVS